LKQEPQHLPYIISQAWHHHYLPAEWKAYQVQQFQLAEIAISGYIVIENFWEHLPFQPGQKQIKWLIQRKVLQSGQVNISTEVLFEISAKVLKKIMTNEI
jgi:hypothetical protein